VWLEDAGQGWLTLANDAPETLDAETLARLGERFFSAGRAKRQRQRPGLVDCPPRRTAVWAGIVPVAA
jgi:two-component system sensor histidine kinase QseC